MTKYDNETANPEQDTFVHTKQTVLLVNFPREYLDYLWQFPEFHVIHCPDMESALRELRQGQTPGGLLYAKDTEEALAFLRRVSGVLEVAQSKIPLFFIPAADQNSEGATALARSGGYPLSNVSPEIAANHFLKYFFDISPNHYFQECRMKTPKDYRAEIHGKLQQFGLLPHNPEAEQMLLNAALRSKDFENRYDDEAGALREALGNMGLGWEDFWKQVYPKAADPAERSLLIEEACHCIWKGLFPYTVVRESKIPCSPIAQYVLKRQTSLFGTSFVS